MAVHSWAAFFMGTPMRDELRRAIIETSSRLGIDPVDLATAMSYETGGTFDPWQRGPTTKWGTHRGLIQWGEPQARQYGVSKDTPVAAQVEAAGQYLVDRGVRPGAGLLEIYSAINAGGVGDKYYGKSDTAAGGAPGTVRDKVNDQMGGHRRKAMALLGSDPVREFTGPLPADQAPVASIGVGQPNMTMAPGGIDPVRFGGMAVPFSPDTSMKKYVPGAVAAQEPSPPQLPGTLAPALGRTEIDPPQTPMPMQGPPMPAPAQGPASMLALANLFGSMGTEQPQFSPVQIRGPSPEQANALASFIEALKKRVV